MPTDKNAPVPHRPAEEQPAPQLLLNKDTLQDLSAPDGDALKGGAHLVSRCSNGNSGCGDT